MFFHNKYGLMNFIRRNGAGKQIEEEKMMIRKYQIAKN